MGWGRSPGFGSAIPRVRYSETRMNQGSGGGKCYKPLVGISDPRFSGCRRHAYAAQYTATVMQYNVHPMYGTYRDSAAIPSKTYSFADSMN